MKLEEFSQQFDVLLDSYASQIEFGKDMTSVDISCTEYEKSVFLTNFQNEFVISLYTGRNFSGAGFEETEELRSYLSPLIKAVELTPIDTESLKPIPISNNSTFFFFGSTGENIPVWFIVYEAVKLADTVPDNCLKGAVLEVKPITHDEYHKIKNNPFRGANRRRALRLELSKDTSVEKIEIICPYTIDKYQCRYLEKPTPIVLTSLPRENSIDGYHNATECTLPTSLHSKILEGAVRMALQSKIKGTNK